eukprot:403349460
MQYMQLDEDLEDMYGPLGLKKAKLIFIPLNDNQDQQKLRGGTHWALLVYINNEKLTQKYFLLDSSQSKGTSGMLNMANKIKKRIQYLINPDQSQDKISKESIVVLGDTPVQNNCYDCGMYVLCFTETILNHIFKNQNFQSNPQELLNFLDLIDESKKIDFSYINKDFIYETRYKIQEIIAKLIEEKNKQ